MPGILQQQLALTAEFQAMADWEARYAAIIARAKRLAPMPDELKTDERKVRGCSSSVWLHAELRDGTLHLLADSDAVLVRGLVALLLEVYSGRTPREILAAPPAFIEELGLAQHLSPNRANGLTAMVGAIMARARAAQAAAP